MVAGSIFALVVKKKAMMETQKVARKDSFVCLIFLVELVAE